MATHIINWVYINKECWNTHYKKTIVLRQYWYIIFNFVMTIRKKASKNVKLVDIHGEYIGI